MHYNFVRIHQSLRVTPQKGTAWTRFAILKGGSDWKAEGSDWYIDGGEQEPSFSLKLLLAGPLAASSRIGFRLAVDLP